MGVGVRLLNMKFRKRHHHVSGCYIIDERSHHFVKGTKIVRSPLLIIQSGLPNYQTHVIILLAWFPFCGFLPSKNTKGTRDISAFVPAENCH